MKQEKSAHHDPAPALTRGLRVLDLLAVDGQTSLERLSRKTGWPKSSVMRYLLALQLAGAVEQDPSSKSWSALRSLKKLPDTHSKPIAIASRLLVPLAQASGHCVELYEASPEKLELIDRAEPEFDEVAIVARVGYIRDLTELDSTAILFFAFKENARPSSKMWHWDAGEKRKVSKTEVQKLLKRAHSKGYATDNDFNKNGIRRFATPLFDSNQKLLGILAIAQRQTPKAESEKEKIIERLIHSTPNTL